MRRLLLVLITAAVLIGAGPGLAGAQDEPTTTTAVELPPAHIVPRPNSGHAPTEAGDRGGALQLGLLAGLVVVITIGVLHLVRESRRARGER